MNLVRAFVFGWISLGLVACGGGSVNIYHRNPERFPIAPEPILARLEKEIEDDQATHASLVELSSNEEYVFKWGAFWDALSQRPFRDALYAKHASQLKRMGEQRCDTYPQYLRFLLSVRGNLEEVIAKDRVCNAALNPDLVFSLVEQSIAGEKFSQERAQAALRFLSLESAKDGQTESWASEFSTHRDLVRQIGSASDPLLFYALVTQLHLRFGASSYPAEVLGDLLAKPENLAVWFGVNGEQRAVHLLGAMAKDRSFDFTREQIANLVNDLETRLAGGEAGTLGKQYLASVTLVQQLSVRWALGDRLHELDRLLRATEKNLLARKSEERLQLLKGWFGQYKESEQVAFIHWMVYRTAPDLKAFPGVFANQSPTFDADPTSRIMGLLVRTATAEPKRALHLAKEICQVFEEQNLLSHDLDADELETSLGKGLAPGCFRISGELKAISSETPLSSSFASLLFVENQSLNLSAPTIALGPLLLSTTHQHPKPVPTPLLPSANALAFPLLLSVELENDTPFLKGGRSFSRGTHFFIYHFVGRKAAPGEPEPLKPRAGFAGPDAAIVATQESPRLIFASVGGPGQHGVPARRGGNGDVSALEMGLLRDWIINISDRGLVKTMPSYFIHDRLTLEEADVLLENAIKDGSGSPKAHTLEDYTLVLPYPMLSKAVLLCRLEGGAELSLRRCLSEILSERAMKQLRAQMSLDRGNGNVSPRKPYPPLDAHLEFLLEEGTLGPENPDGPDGEPGKLKKES